MENSLFANHNPEMIYPSEISDGHISEDENMMPMDMVAGPSSRQDYMHPEMLPPGNKRAKRNQENQSVFAVSTKEPEYQSLFSIVRHGRQALQSVVDDWIEGYKKDKDQALLELINYLIQSCGCKGVVTPEMFVTMDQTEIIQRVTEDFDEDSGDYPLIQSGPTWKKFRSNFTEFIVVLVRQCQSSLIFDQYLFENVISLLTGLCDSQARAFRHTSVLAAMKLMTALVTVASTISVNQEKISRQYESEKAKNPLKRASGKVEFLKNKQAEFESHINEVQTMISNIFNGIFVHRYRDTHAEIRAICMGEIGTWIKSYPTYFLDDGYLRYIGWNLHDKNWDVRLRCLQALNSLYTCEEIASNLELFTNRFKDRIVSMTLDKKTEVAVQAIRLITCINNCKEDALDNTDCESVYQLVFSAHRLVAQAAGQFLNQRLLVRDDETQQQIQNRLQQKKRGRKFSPNIAPMRDLVQYFIESELHEHAAYLVDSLWDSTAIIKDWDCMTQMLLEDVSSEMEPLNDKEEAYLIDIMTCCVRQASEGVTPVGRAQSKKLSGKEKLNVHEDKLKLSTHFIQTLPHLLSKHGIDPDKVADLVIIPQYFDLDIYISGRLEQHLEPLLKLLTEIVTKHTEKEILDNCAKTFESLCMESYTVSNKCKITKSSLIDNLTATFQAAWQDYVENLVDVSENEVYNLSAAIRRIHAFYAAHNLNSWDLYDLLFKIAHCYAENIHVNPKIVCDAIASLQHYLMWAKIDLDENNPDKNEMKILKRRIGEVMGLCIEIMNTHSEQEVKEDAYILISDLLIYYAKQLAFKKAFKPLVYVADMNLQNDLTRFVERHVFVKDEQDFDDEDDETQKIEALHKRRNLLACFCKLIVYKGIEVKAAADVFKHYLKFYNDFGDIIKSTLARVNDANRIECAQVIIRALHILWSNLPRIQVNRVDKACEDFAHIKDLAKNFSFLFSTDQIKSREAIQKLHEEGIYYAFTPEQGQYENIGSPPNLDFLEVVNEFTSKMSKQDKKVVSTTLENYIKPYMLESSADFWNILHIYRQNLATADHDVRNMRMRQNLPQIPLSSGHPGKKTPPRKRGYDESSLTDMSMGPGTPMGSVSRVQIQGPSRAERAANRDHMRHLPGGAMESDESTADME